MEIYKTVYSFHSVDVKIHSVETIFFRTHCILNTYVIRCVDRLKQLLAHRIRQLSDNRIMQLLCNRTKYLLTYRNKNLLVYRIKQLFVFKVNKSLAQTWKRWTRFWRVSANFCPMFCHQNYGNLISRVFEDLSLNALGELGWRLFSFPSCYCQRFHLVYGVFMWKIVVVQKNTQYYITPTQIASHLYQKTSHRSIHSLYG